MSTGKRLFYYATHYKKTLIIALLMLTISVGTELTGPFIAKRMIDVHILGIEKPWYHATNSQDAVLYQGNWYKRDDRFTLNERRGEQVHILQVKREFYFVDQSIPILNGEREWTGDKIRITKDDQTAEYTAAQLRDSEVFSFYKPEIGRLVQLSCWYLLLLLISAGFHYAQKYLLQRSANRIIQKMRHDVFDQIQRLPVSFFDNIPAGKVVAHVTNDTEAIRGLYVTVLATFFTGTIYIAGIFTALFLLDYRMAMICFIIIPILWVWIIFYRRFASRYYQVIRSRVSDMNGMINESIQGMPIIQIFRQQHKITKEFKELNDDHLNHQNKLLNLNALTQHNLTNIFRNVFLVALIWYFGGASLSPGSAVTVGIVYAFVDYINRLFQPVNGIVTQLTQLEQARVSAERVFELMDKKGTEVATGNSPRYRGDVKFDKVSFAYKENEYVLKDISFEAKQGQTVALVGHTGSGKSSIMNLLFRFYDVEKGQITIDGKSTQEMPVQWLRQHMGIVLQDPFLFTGTIASNVSLDDPRISRAQVEKALQEVGADILLRNLSKGYDEPVLEKGSTLSSGQRQIISFARALVFNPAILILDEATASVDTETETVIQRALEVLKKGRTTFIIAHRLSTIQEADQILVMDHGRIIERGNHQELLKAKGKYFQMYYLQKSSLHVQHDREVI